MFITFFVFILFMCLLLAGGLVFHMSLIFQSARSAHKAHRPIVSDASHTARLHAALFQ